MLGCITQNIDFNHRTGSRCSQIHPQPSALLGLVPTQVDKFKTKMGCVCGGGEGNCLWNSPTSVLLTWLGGRRALAWGPRAFALMTVLGKQYSGPGEASHCALFIQ